jgi:hypothetical protein
LVDGPIFIWRLDCVETHNGFVPHFCIYCHPLVIIVLESGIFISYIILQIP